MSDDKISVEFNSIISNDIINFEKFSDILLLKLKADNSILWQDKTFLKYVADYFKCKRIAKKNFINNDKFRTPQNVLLIGDDSWVTIIENKISYSFDIQKCMFSRGNITEKLRISKINCVNQIVVDLYAGIGYFTIPFLVHSRAEHVYACEWNKDAIHSLNINLSKNKVSSKCTVLEGDNVLTCPKDIADRVNLGLIPSSERSWPTACAALKKQFGGTLHIHATIHNNFTLNNLKTEATIIQASNKKRGACNGVQSQGSHPLKTCEILSPDDNIYDDILDDTNRIKLDKIINFTNNQIKLMSPKKKLKPAWIEWSYYVCFRLINILTNLYNKEWHAQLLHIEHIKSYAPHISHIVLDIKCQPI